MQAFKEHLFRIVATLLIAITLYAGQSYVKEFHAEAMAGIQMNTLRNEFFKEDLDEIKAMLRELLKQKK